MAAGYCYCLGIKSNNFFLKDNKKAFILWLNVPKVTAYTDADFEKPGYDSVEWTVVECRHWEKLLVNVCGCMLEEVVDGFVEHSRGYSFDADKANETLSKIGIDIGENGYIYWTSTMERNGLAEVVGCGEIIEDPMPYTDDEIAECRLRFVGRVNIKELKTENLSF